MLEKAGDLAAMLTNLEPHDVYCLSMRSIASRRWWREVLYPAMEDYQLDIMIGGRSGGAFQHSDRSAAVYPDRRHHPRRFVDLAARTPGIVQRHGVLSDPRSAAYCRSRSARHMGLEMSDEGALEVARRSRGTPRIANRLLRRVRDFAEVRHDGTISADIDRPGAGYA